MPRVPLAPRKRPTQERAHATVDAIIEAAAYVLVRRGSVGLTTNAIAERAGVNIASLYQYFPNKESIVAELRSRHVASQRAAARAAWTDLEGAKPIDAVRRILALGIAAHAVEPKLHLALSQLMPGRADAGADDEAMRAQFLAGLAQTGVPDPQLALWLVDTVSHAAIHRAAAERPELLASSLFADELAAMIGLYLTRPRTPTAR